MKLRMMYVVGLTAVLCLSCRREDIRTARIYAPDMTNAEDAALIEAELSAVPGVMANKLEIDLAEHTITVPYDSIRLSLKNIEFVVAESGFTANDVPAKR
ncbi:MAG: heavy-metal-associated domain-containing protein [Lentisphaerae bacterium]|nr:heavy-metal-associated domain-containing protein [Lentisphaerota bacterium]